jgi:hypothetical protein
MELDGEKTQVGDLIDARGVTITLEEGDIITNVILIAEVISEDNSSRIVISSGDGTDWLKEVGMISMAKAARLGDYE